MTCNKSFHLGFLVDGQKTINTQVNCGNSGCAYTKRTRNDISSPLYKFSSAFYTQIGGISAQQWHGFLMQIEGWRSLWEEDAFGDFWNAFRRGIKNSRNIFLTLWGGRRADPFWWVFFQHKGVPLARWTLSYLPWPSFTRARVWSPNQGQEISNVLVKSYLLETAGLDCWLMKFILTSVLSLGWDQVWILWRSWEWLLWTLPDPWWSTTTATDDESEGCDMLEMFLGQESKAMVK